MYVVQEKQETSEEFLYVNGFTERLLGT